jgi:proteasome lid subunit RPN8/RPN11
LTLGSEARRTLEDLLAESADRFEICALAVGERAPAEEVLATDVRPLPARIRGRYWFAVEAGDYRRAVAQVEAARMAVVALVHSHPTPDLRPSLGDRMLLRATGLPQLIVARRGGGGVAAGCYALHGSRIEPVEVAVAGRSQ